MQLTEMAFEGGSPPIDGYGPGFTRVGGKVIQGPLTLLPSGVRAWGGYGDLGVLLAEAGALDVLFVGTGAALAIPPLPFRRALEAMGAGVEPMPTPSACRTYNVLLSEGRRIGLALIPV